MDMYDSLFSASCVLNEQVARQIFEILPEEGPIMLIIDREGHSWPSNTEKFSELNISESFLKEMCEKIDDGDEPIVSQVDNNSIIAAQLTTERTNCGYVIFALPQYVPESALANIDLITILINQVNLIAKLIENNSLLYEFQMKQMSIYGQPEAGSN